VSSFDLQFDGSFDPSPAPRSDPATAVSLLIVAGTIRDSTEFDHVLIMPAPSLTNAKRSR